MHKHKSIRSSLVFIWRPVKEANFLTKSTMDNKIVDLLTLRAFGLSSRPSNPPFVTPVFWFLPHCGWIKVNTDGISFGTPVDGGYGGVFRTCRPFVKGCFAVPLNYFFAFEEKLFIGNQVADALASYSIMLAFDTWWFNAPIFCHPFLANDFVGRHSYQFR
ncbi:hypothetical protein UlMin_029910 [Ulmus minor]